METNQIDEYQIYRDMAPVILTGTLAFLFALTPLWQFTVLAAFIGGFFCTTMKRGAFTGTVGVFFAWFLYLLLNPVYVLADQLGALILGSHGMGWLILSIIFLIGAILGLLGGSIGSGIRMLVFSRTSTAQTNKADPM